MTNGVFDFSMPGTSPIWQMPANWVTACCRCEQRCLHQTAERGFPPRYPLEQRMIVLGALEAVDWVVRLKKTRRSA